MVLQVGGDELNEALRPIETLERERTEILQRPAVHRIASERTRRAPGKEDLSAVRSRTDSGGAMDLEPDVPVGCAFASPQCRPTRAHPHVVWLGMLRERSLDGDGRPGSLGGSRERAERAVPVEVDDCAATRPTAPVTICRNASSTAG